MAYSTPADVLGWLNQTGAAVTDRSPVLAPKAISAADEWIDGYCNRSFDKTPTAAMEFRGGPGRGLYVGDVVTVAGVDARTTAAADAWTELAADRWALAPPEFGWPSDTIWAMGGYRWPCLQYPLTSVRVRGTFGWAAVPEKVREASTLLACHYLTLFGSEHLSGGEVAEPAFADPAAAGEVGVLLRSLRRIAVA